VELRPFRCLRYSPRVLFERGLAALLASSEGGALPAAAAPENVGRLLSASDEASRAAAAATLASWIGSGVLLRERRPALWIYRRAPSGREPGPPLLIGLARLTPAPPAAARSDEPDGARAADRTDWLRAMRVAFAPTVLATRAPLAGALATSRRPDLSGETADGVRHDAWRVSDYAQHVELQGLVKNVEVEIVRGLSRWEAARAFAADPEAARLPGARYRLCAIGEESALAPDPASAEVPAGLLGVSLEDPVY
jgi:hypothetical protein